MHCLELCLASLPATTRRAVRRLKLHRETLQPSSLLLRAGFSFSTPFGSATQEQQAALRRCAQHTIAVRVVGNDVCVTGMPTNAVLLNATPMSSHAPHHLAHGDIITLASGSDFVIAYVFRTDRGTAPSPDQLIDLTSASSTTATARTSQITRPVINDAGEDGTIVEDGATARNGVTETRPVINRADDNADESPTYSAVGSVAYETLPGESRMRRYRSWLSSDDVAGRNVRPRVDVLGVDAIVHSPPRIPRRSQRLAARKEKPFWSVFNDNCTIS